MLEARRNHAHQAIVAWASGDGGLQPGLAVINAESYSAPFGPPVLQVPIEAGSWLTEAVQEGRTLELHAQSIREATTASNVQATITGRNPNLAPLVIMTPKSAWWTCTAERAGGISVWLNAIRHFAAMRPARTVMFTTNTGHELGHVGLDRYLEENPGLIRRAHAWIHLGANFASRDAVVRYQASDEALMTQGLHALGAAGVRELETTPVGERPLGEARNIFDGGGAYISLLGANPWFHQPEDRWPVSVDLDKTTRLAEALVGLAASLARG